MGNPVSFQGHKIRDTQKTISYTGRYWDSCKYHSEESGCSGGYTYYGSSSSMTVKGELVGDSPNVFVNGKKVSYVSGKTKEQDVWNKPSDYYSGGTTHNTAQGSITAGSSKVFVNGKAIAFKTSQVRTHENTSTNVEQGSANVFAG